MTHIMIATMCKNASKYLDTYWKCIKQLDYPKDKIRIVIIYGDSWDDTLKKLKEFKEEGVVELEVFRESSVPRVKGSFLSASIYNDFKGLVKDEDDYILFLDVDLEFPPNLVKELIKVKGDIVAPYVFFKNREGQDIFYNTWEFRYKGKRFDPLSPVGLGEHYPIEVDSVGSCFLNTREVWINMPAGDPYPDVYYCNYARKCGYQIVVLPYLKVYHPSPYEDPKIAKSPLDPRLGGYPEKEEFATSRETVEPFRKKTKEELDAFYQAKLDKFLEYIKRRAKQLQEVFKDQNYRFCYNKAFNEVFFCTRNPEVINLMYKTEMLPPFVEVELSNICPYRCRMCERTYIKDEEPRLMSWKEFMLIMKNFPTLKQCSFTGIGDIWANPIALDAIKFVKKERDAIFEQYDTFQKITPEVAEKLVKWKVDSLLVSIDAGTKQTYENFRRGMKWDKMIEGVNNLLKAKRKYKSYLPTLAWHFVINKANVHEVIKIQDFILTFDLRPEERHIFYNRLLHNYPEISDIYMEIPEDLKKTILLEAQKRNIHVSFNAPTSPSLQAPINYCTDFWQPFIFVNGDVFPCCCQHESNRRFWEFSLRLGNIFETKDLRKIWFGSRWRHLRRTLYQGRLPEVCVDCPTYNWRGYDRKPIMRYGEK